MLDSKVKIIKYAESISAHLAASLTNGLICRWLNIQFIQYFLAAKQNLVHMLLYDALLNCIFSCNYSDWQLTPSQG